MSFTALEEMTISIAAMVDWIAPTAPAMITPASHGGSTVIAITGVVWSATSGTMFISRAAGPIKVMMPCQKVTNTTPTRMAPCRDLVSL